MKVTRAIDRNAMATRLEHIVRQHRATVERDPVMTREREIWLRIEAQRGLAVTIDLDGDSKQQRAGVFVLAWHIGTRHNTRLAAAFGRAAGGAVNPFHRSKCTGIAMGFEELCTQLDECLALADDGRAFEVSP